MSDEVSVSRLHPWLLNPNYHITAMTNNYDGKSQIEKEKELTESNLKNMNFEISDPLFKQSISRQNPPMLSLNKYKLNSRAKMSKRTIFWQYPMANSFNEDKQIKPVVYNGVEIGPRSVRMPLQKLNFDQDKKGSSAFYRNLNLNMKNVIRYLRNRQALRMNAMNFGKRSMKKMDHELLHRGKDKQPYSKTRQRPRKKGGNGPYSKETIQDIIDYTLNLRNREAWRSIDYLLNLHNGGESRMHTMNFEKRSTEKMNFGQGTTGQIGVKSLNKDKDKRPYSKTRQTPIMESLSDAHSKEDLQDVEEYIQNFLFWRYGKPNELSISDQYHVKMESPEN